MAEMPALRSLTMEEFALSPQSGVRFLYRRYSTMISATHTKRRNTGANLDGAGLETNLRQMQMVANGSGPTIAKL
jgi:hypothetical protein